MGPPLHAPAPPPGAHARGVAGAGEQRAAVALRLRAGDQHGGGPDLQHLPPQGRGELLQCQTDGAARLHGWCQDGTSRSGQAAACGIYHVWAPTHSRLSHAPSANQQVAEGSDADVIIFDPAVRHTISAKGHHSAMDTNIYEGYEVTGKVSAFVRLQGKVPLKACAATTGQGIAGGGARGVG